MHRLQQLSDDVANIIVSSQSLIDVLAATVGHTGLLCPEAISHELLIRAMEASQLSFCDEAAERCSGCLSECADGAVTHAE